jgi:hypothetical protein
MNDHQLDQLIESGAPGYRPPPSADFEATWQQIRHRRVRRVSRSLVHWWRPLALAASLGLAFSLGRWSHSPAQAPVVVANTPDQPVTMVATALLGESVVLLSSLPQDAGDAHDQRFAREAGDLLTTTRLLLDAPVSQQNPALKALLEDLELVLAQVARLHNGESHTERDLIRDAVTQQDLVPRIRSVAAHLTAGD